MFIPIGHEEQTVRRLPWVVFVLIAANLLFFLSAGQSARRAEERAQQALQEVIDYWQGHPWLDLPPAFAEIAIPEGQREEVRLLSEASKSITGDLSAEERAEQQRELERLTDAFLTARGDHPYFGWGLVPAHFSLVALFTSMFMHAGWFHLLGNLFMLWLAGPSVEDAYGRPLFATLYLASGVVAALTHVAVFSSSVEPLVGASGAIAGIMGAFLVRFARTRIRFFYWWFLRGGTFDAPAWLMLSLWVAQQAFYGMLTKSQDGVAYWAHVGGFGFGMIVALVIKQQGIEERFIRPVIERKISIEQDPALEEAMGLMARRETVAAREAFARVLAIDPRNPDAHLGIWQSWVWDEEPAKGAEHMTRAIEIELRNGEHDLAVAHWRELVAASKSGGPPALRFRLASELQERQPAAAGEILANLATDASAGMLAAKAALRLAAMSESPAEKAHWTAIAAGQAPPAGAAAGQVAAPRAAVPARPSPAPLVATPPGQAAPARGAPSPQGPVPPPSWAGGGAGATAPAPSETVRLASEAEPHAAASAAEEPVGIAVGGVVQPGSLDRLEEEGLVLVGGEGIELVPYSEVKLVAVAGIMKEGKPYLVIDLLLDERLAGERPVIRLVSSELDPGKLVGRPELKAMDAFRELVRTIVSGSSAVLLPSPALLDGAPPATFATLAEYEERVLKPAGAWI